MPGYRNIPTPEAYRNIKVVLAAAQEPLLYRTSHSYSGYTGLYEVAPGSAIPAHCTGYTLPLPGGRGRPWWCGTSSGANTRQGRIEAIAWFTGHIWLEVKVLLLIPTVLSVFWLLSWLDGLIYNPWILPLRPAPLLVGFYALYLNDLRYNFGAAVLQQLLRRPCPAVPGR